MTTKPRKSENTFGDFGFALSSMRCGKRVARLAWEGERFILVATLNVGESVISSDIYVVDADGGFGSWSPPEGELLALDWVEAPIN